MSGRGYDPGVLLRARRFIAEGLGYRLVRGHYMDQDEDRADRWYVVPRDEPDPPREGPGFRTAELAVAEARRLAANIDVGE